MKKQKSVKKSKEVDKEEPRTIDSIKADSELTDVVAGPMTLTELCQEITKAALAKSPEYMVILMEKDPKIKKYRSAIYMTKEDFKKPYQRY